MEALRMIAGILTRRRRAAR